ncbi:hypothetical protein D3C79_383940 [compost metagenome]
MAAETGFSAHLQLNLFLFLPFLGDDIDQAAGAAAAIQRGGAGNHLNVFYVERIDGIQLAAVAARRIQTHAVDHHHHRTAAHVHAVVGTALAADIHTRDQLRQNIFDFLAALDLLLNFLAFNHPGGLRHLCHAAVRAAGGYHHLIFAFLFFCPGRRRKHRQQAWVQYPKVFAFHRYFSSVPMLVCH